MEEITCRLRMTCSFVFILHFSAVPDLGPYANQRSAKEKQNLFFMCSTLLLKEMKLSLFCLSIFR